eukprot:gene40316-53287_t
MSTLETQLNARSADFQANAAAMRAVVDDLRAQVAKSTFGGGEAARAKHTKRGKLLPRDRVQMLLDPGTPFLEVAPLAALNMYNNDAPSSGVIVGIGRVSGVDCMIVCNDATVKGGTYYPMTVKKHLRAQEIAQQNHLPCIYLEPTLDDLLSRAARPRVVALGETGLDYYRLNGRTVADMEWQRERFRVHIRAAHRTRLPLTYAVRRCEPHEEAA